MARYHSADPKVKEKATEEILNDYRRFITHLITKHFSSYMNRHFDDLFSSGLIGLMEALTKYDPEKSMPTTFFATYIVHEIYNYVATFVNQTTPYYALRITKLNKAKAELEHEGNDNPSVIDLAMKTGLKPEIVMKTMAIQSASQTQSFDSEEFIFNEMSADAQLQPEAVVIRNEGQAILHKAVRDLPDDMREVLVRKLGMGNQKAQTNEQISKETGISTNNVRYLYSKALEQLREGEVFDFFVSQYRAKPRFAKDMVALVPEDSAERMITTLLEFDGGFDDELNV